MEKNSKKVLLIGSGMMTAPFIEYILGRPENKLTVASNTRELLNETLKRFAGKILKEQSLTYLRTITS